MIDNPQHPQVITVSGGTGSFGRAFVRFLLDETAAHVRVLSRDEHKQNDMQRDQPPGQRLTYILGDVRDYMKLCQAFDGADAVVHAAANKTVPQGERQADEFTMTNVLGTLYVVRAAIECGVGRSLFISSDKAVSAYNGYGKSKAAAEPLFIQGNSLGTHRGCRFSVVRGGNVWGSRGSVAEVWRAAAQAGQALSVFGATATRFHMQMDTWTRFCWRVLTEAHGGEVMVPKLRAWSLLKLAQAYSRNLAVMPPRPGDKLHESMIAPEEVQRTVDLDWAYAIEPSAPFREIWNYRPWPCPTVPVDWRYSSDSVAQLDNDEMARLAQEVP